MIQHRQSRRLLLAILLLCATSATAALGQTLPRAVIEASSAQAAASSRPQIDQYVAAQVALLGAPATQKAGRDHLISEVMKGGATPDFLDVYAQSLNDKVLPLARNANAAVRLNAAIAVARVAAKAQNGRLAPATAAFVQDKSDAVVLWGMKAAQYILPAMIASAQTADATKLGQAIVSAANSHPASGAIVEDAYNAVLLNSADINKLPAPGLSAFVAQPMALFESRVKLYIDLVPPQPSTDATGAAFFVKSPVWNSQTPAQQGHNLQTMVALLRGAAKQNAGTVQPELVDVIRRTGDALQVAAGLQRNAPLRVAAKSVSSIGNDTAPDEIDNRIKAVEGALKGATSATAGGAGAGGAPVVGTP